ncbi:MAG: hypothetical protein NC247_04980 [Ruminococcus flavefaciens]|nr:hypothetical protein [Ruminococcus flavefaciens]MCM1361032.1 hypothetical protein [Clostridiales bacterium]
MIGFLCNVLLPYYDKSMKKMSYKNRPALVIGKADGEDYNILPVSRVTNRLYLDAVYDVPVDPKIYPNSKLTAYSYIRVHKQTAANKSRMRIISNFKEEYPDLFLAVLQKLEEYNKNLIDDTLAAVV